MSINITYILIKNEAELVRKVASKCGVLNGIRGLDIAILILHIDND